VNGPTIAEAKKFAKSHGASGAVLIAFTDDDVAATSYGADRRRCSDMETCMDKLIDALESGAVTAWRDEGDGDVDQVQR